MNRFFGRTPAHGAAALIAFWLGILLLLTTGVVRADFISGSLSIGQTTTAKYGNRFEGVSNRAEVGYVAFQFRSNGDPLTLDVTGFDIDVARELAVEINGNRIGYLADTANNSRGATSLEIPATAIVGVTNTITFRQRRSNYTWGVTNILIRKSDTAQSCGVLLDECQRQRTDLVLDLADARADLEDVRTELDTALARATAAEGELASLRAYCDSLEDGLDEAYPDGWSLQDVRGNACGPPGSGS